MGLNISKGNMYDFVTHTWNVIKGECYHDCSYCYMKRWGKLNPVRFDEKELKTDLGKDNFIFVGSSCDMFAENIPYEWIDKTVEYCNKFNNKYLFQTKNPINIKDNYLPNDSVVCVTVESNRIYPELWNKAPSPNKRISGFDQLKEAKFITIEPILDFDIEIMIHLMKLLWPIQINIGADSGGNNLPEPPKEKILELISELEKFTKVKQKKNLKRLLK